MEEHDSHESGEIEYPDVHVLLLLGPSAIGKKQLILSLAEKYPTLFHIIRTLTTKPPKTREDRIFFDYITEEEFLHWRDHAKGFFWTTYERVKPGTEEGTFLFGLPAATFLYTPNGMYGILGISSLGQHLEFFEYLNKKELREVKPTTLQLLLGPFPNDQENILSINLRKKGLAEDVVSKRLVLAQQMEDMSSEISDANVLLVGNDEIDLIQTCDTLRRLGIQLEYK